MTIYDEIEEERERQRIAWPDDHDPLVYCAVLMEEVGEVARAIHDVRFSPTFDGDDKLTDARAELIQVAAVAVQMVERIDTGRMPWKR